MRNACIALVILAGAVEAAPVAQLAKDVDGDGGEDAVELDPTGELRIKTKTGTSAVKVGLVKRATLSAATVRGTPTIIVQSATEGIVVQRAGGGWRQLVRTPLASGGLDGEFAYALDARPEGFYRYQTRAGALGRCDGQPASVNVKFFSYGIMAVEAGIKIKRIAFYLTFKRNRLVSSYL